ncbi:MAG: hypothetical protein ACQES5_02440 [Thermodesulfobacteriota bacterium]
MREITAFLATQQTTRKKHSNLYAWSRKLRRKCLDYMKTQSALLEKKTVMVGRYYQGVPKPATWSR